MRRSGIWITVQRRRMPDPQGNHHSELALDASARAQRIHVGFPWIRSRIAPRSLNRTVASLRLDKTSAPKRYDDR